MKQEQLLDAIGGVEEGMLMETEQPVRRGHFGVGKALLIAAVIAALAVTAGAVKGIFSLPITDSQILTDETAAPFSMDSQGNILPGAVSGLKITMDVDVDESAPDYLEEYYLLDTPSGWQGGGMGTPAGRYWFSSWDQIFWKNAYGDRIELYQQTVHNYLASGHQVDSLVKLSEEDGVTAQTATVAGLKVLKITIPELPWYDGNDGHLYCPQGETRLYWSDGRYILRLKYPAWVTDAEAEVLLQTLHTEKVILNVPENYGKVNLQLLRELKPLFCVEQSSNTAANVQTAQGRMALHNGKLYIGAPGQIIAYDLETGQEQRYTLANRYTDPKYLFATDNYVGYVTDYDRLELLPLDGSAPEQMAYEGIDSTHLYADGMTLYAMGYGLRTIDLSTGEITRLVPNAIGYDVDEQYVYAVEKDGHHFFRAQKGSAEFEKIDLGFYPIRVQADGQDLYFCAGGEGTEYPVIHYRDGVTTKLPVNAWLYQILDGKLIYLDQKDKKNPVKSYDLETGEIETLQENVFEFSIVQDRYLCCVLYNDGYTVLDLHTGETIRISD